KASSRENGATEIPNTLFGPLQPRPADVVVEESHPSTPERLLPRPQLHPFREALENLKTVHAAELESQKPARIPSWTARAALWLVIFTATAAGGYFLWTQYGHEIDRTALLTSREVATWLQNDGRTAKTSGEATVVTTPELAASAATPEPAASAATPEPAASAEIPVPAASLNPAAPKPAQ